MSEMTFSKTISGEIPNSKIYENDYVYVPPDISQVSKGHTLLAPKRPSANISETDEETIKHVGVALSKVVNTIKNAFHPDGLNVTQNSGEYVDQSVFHAHFHLIPRYENDIDGFGYKWETHEDVIDDETKQKIAIQTRVQIS